MMDKRYKIGLVSALLVGLLVLGVTAFFVAGGSGASSGGDSDGGSNVMFIIMISQIPIWTSLAVAKREQRKKKEAHKAKNDDYYMDEEYYEDAVLSNYDGEIVGYDEREEQQQSMFNR